MEKVTFLPRSMEALRALELAFPPKSEAKQVCRVWTGMPLGSLSRVRLQSFIRACSAVFVEFGNTAVFFACWVAASM